MSTRAVPDPGSSDPPRRSPGICSLFRTGVGSPFSSGDPNSDMPREEGPKRMQGEENGHDSPLLQNGPRPQLEPGEHGRAYSARPSGARMAESVGLLGVERGDEEEAVEPGFDSDFEVEEARIPAQARPVPVPAPCAPL